MLDSRNIGLSEGCASLAARAARNLPTIDDL